MVGGVGERKKLKVSPRCLWKNQLEEKENESSFGPAELGVSLSVLMEMTCVPLHGQIWSQAGSELDRPVCSWNPWGNEITALR